MQLTEVFVLSVDGPFAMLKGHLDNVFDVVAVLLVLFDQSLLDIHSQGSFGDNDVGGEERSLGLVWGLTNAVLDSVCPGVLVGDWGQHFYF